ncbi:MAG: methyltransferase domain-containing protein [Rhizobiales bacterium]|nr:methyltransferase domain-containing protein [Hyphomicrobiales bacterium]
MNILPDFILRRVAANRTHWPRLVHFAARINRIGLYLSAQSRILLKTIYPDTDFSAGNDFVVSQYALQAKVDAVLKRYQADPEAYKYFFGQPYQGLGIAGIFGDRISDYRFDDYELRRFIKEGDRVLDIGCNCGFIGILASYRTGCHATGIDINPHMVEIGKLAAEHLRISHLVEMKAGRLQDYNPETPFDVVLSFATHWTDDNNYRVSIEDHMARMAGYLKKGGTLIFETHCNDVGNAEFYAALEATKTLFSFDGLYKQTDSKTRELYIMKRN